MDEPSPQKETVTFRDSLRQILHEGRGRAGHAFQFFLIIIILFSAALIPLEFLPDFPAFQLGVHVLEGIIVGIFTAEYALRIYSAQRRWRYVFSFFGIIDLLSIVPFYAGVFGTPAIRLVRLVRLLKLAEIESAAAKDQRVVVDKDLGLLPDEDVHYVVTKHPIVLLLGCIPPALSFGFALGLLFITEANLAGIAGACALIIFGLLFLLKAWFDFSYDVLYVTNYRIILHNQHLLGRSINQVNLRSITNIKPSYPNAMSYILRYGTLTLDTAAEMPGQVQINHVKRHEQAAKLITNAWHHQEQREQNIMQGTITSL